MSNDKKWVLFFDTETNKKPIDLKMSHTEVHNWPRLVQLAMILQAPDGTFQEYKSLVRPEDGKAFPMSEGAFKIHGITDEKCVAEGRDLDVVLLEFRDWLHQADAIVAHNIAFDRPVMKCEAFRRSVNLVIKSSASFVCTQSSTTKFCGLPTDWGKGFKWPSLQELHTKLFGEGFEDAHDALVDVQATRRCYNELSKIGSWQRSDSFIKN